MTTLAPGTNEAIASMMNRGRFIRRLTLSFLLLLGPSAPVWAQIPEQYPKPLIHTSTDHPAARVLLISVDGLHGFDLANYVAAHPSSTLAGLSAHGVTFTNAHAPWANPLSGLASIVTGGGPISTGIYATEVEPPLPASTTPSGSTSGVNTLFEVVHEKIGPTAWAGESDAAMSLLRGPSGKGLDRAQLVARTPLASGDASRFDAVHAWIDDTQQPVPSLFGLNVAGVAEAQTSRTPAYADLAGTPSAALTKALDQLDGQVARLVAALEVRHLSGSTWIVIVGPYGEPHVDPRRSRVIALSTLVASLKPLGVAHLSGGDIGMVWLNDRAATPAAVAALDLHATQFGIADIIAGPRLALLFNQRGSRDARAPDLILVPTANVVYGTPTHGSTSAKGGLSDWDTHVALLVSGSQLAGRGDPTWVPTTQLAPLLLRSLGLEKFDLDALHLEHTPALPGIF